MSLVAEFDVWQCWPDYNTRIVLAGSSLLGLCAGVIGCYALLKKRALTGDALAHASLPGVCLAYLIAGDRSLPVLLAGALVTGVLGIATLALLRRFTRLKEDAALGFVLSVPFGVGVVLLSAIQRQTEGNKAGLNSFIQGNAARMLREDVIFMGALVIATLLIVVLLFKEFRLVSFDPGFARVQGWPTQLLDFVLMSLVVLVVVIGLPAVGVLLMAALLIIPPAAARFWTERLSVMAVLSGIFGMIAGMLGTLASARLDRLPTGPAIILVATGFFVVSLVCAPRRGLLARWYLSRRTTHVPP